MAAKKAKRKSMNIEPSVMTIQLATPSTAPGATTHNYVDLSQLTSILNRRFMRQGLNWAVAGFKVSTASPAAGTSIKGQVVISKLWNTWTMSNAWEKAFRAWNKQQMDSIEEAGAESAVARFRDFKIHMDVDHVTAGFAGNLLPYDASGNIALPGEWQESLIVVPNVLPGVGGDNVEPIEYKLHAVGINNNGGQSRGIIEGYADSRAYPQSPDPVAPAIGATGNWLRDMFDVGNDNSEITENATERNNDLPYDQVNYPGGETQLPGLQIHDSSKISATTIGGNTYLKGGNFPCGLIKISHYCDPESISHNVSLLVDLVPGTLRGYMAEPMTEM